MLWNLLFSVVGKWKVLLGALCAIALGIATTSAIYWRAQYQNLTALNASLSEQAKAATETVDALLAKVKEEHEKAEERLRDERDQHLAELSGLRGELSKARKRINTLTAAECRRTSAVALEHLERGAELATRCAEELAERQQALKTCVRMYQDLESVYDHSK